jgi:hypothetical protein
MKLLFALGAIATLMLGPLPAQQSPGPTAPAKPPQALGDMLARAMQSNPEVLLAEARLEQARAELNQVRLKVTQEVIEAHAQRQALRHRIRGVHDRMEQAKALHANGVLPVDELRQAEVTLCESEGALAASEAQIRYLLGMGGMARPPSGPVASPTREAPPAKRPPIPERFAKALELEGTMHFEKVSLELILRNLSKASGIAFLFHPDFGDAEWTLDLDLGERPVTLRQTLLALADLHGSACFAIRDYGILVVDRGDAESMPCPVIPETVPLRQ